MLENQGFSWLAESPSTTADGCPIHAQRGQTQIAACAAGTILCLTDESEVVLADTEAGFQARLDAGETLSLAQPCEWELGASPGLAP